MANERCAKKSQFSLIEHSVKALGIQSSLLLTLRKFNYTKLKRSDNGVIWKWRHL